MKKKGKGNWVRRTVAYKFHKTFKKSENKLNC